MSRSREVEYEYDVATIRDTIQRKTYEQNQRKYVTDREGGREKGGRGTVEPRSKCFPSTSTEVMPKVSSNSTGEADMPDRARRSHPKKRERERERDEEEKKERERRVDAFSHSFVYWGEGSNFLP